LTGFGNLVIRQLATDETQSFDKTWEFQVPRVLNCSSIMRRTVTIFFLLLIASGYFSQRLLASPRLPNVTPEMETPGFWIKKIENPKNPLLTPEKIHKMNEENLKKTDLRLCRIKDLKEDWSREEILSFLAEDWENFGRTAEARYGKTGALLGDFFWSKLKGNLNQESLQQRTRVFFALIANRTDIRVFPTDEPSMSTRNNDEFDRFQHSSISVGSPVGIYYFSQDKKWAYTQTPFIRGWIRTHDLAVAREKAEVVDYEETENRLVVTGNSATVFGDPSLRQSTFVAQMGDSFPLLSASDGSKKAHGFHVILIPSKNNSEPMSLRKGYLRADEDAHQGFLPYTQENVARQAFKMLHHPYGWGDRRGGRDCSRFLMDLFRTFGILMPRNSKEQAWVGKDLGPAEGKPIQEKRKILDQSIPLATTLRLPGHIMLYLGKDTGKHYVIHSIWGVQKSGRAGPSLQKIGKVVVSDLSLGEKGPNESLLDRITDIRIIGSGPEIQEKQTHKTSEDR
jgi:cell wall-associated NlpC family hydrolase